jgi:hypothetical protein
MKKVISASVVVLCLLSPVLASAGQKGKGYTLSRYDIPPTLGSETSLFDLERGGDFLIGIYFGDRLHAFSVDLRAEAFTSYDVGNNFITFATAVSDLAVVGSTEQPDGRRVGTIWPRASSREAWGTILAPLIPSLPRQGPLIIDISGYQSTALLGLNARGDLVGAVQRPDFTFRGFVIAAGQLSLFDYPAAQSTQAEGIRQDGTIVGTYTLNNRTHGFVLPPSGHFTTFDVPHACGTSISDTNERGDLAGSYVDCGSQQTRGYVFTRAQRLIPIIYPGGDTTQTEVLGLDERGNIAGRFDTATGRHGFLGLQHRRSRKR